MEQSIEFAMWIVNNCQLDKGYWLMQIETTLTNKERFGIFSKRDMEELFQVFEHETKTA